MKALTLFFVVLLALVSAAASMALSQLESVPGTTLIRAHPADVRRPSALNGRCWARALAGRELDQALRDCDAALRLRPGEAEFLDSRGLVQLRRGDLAKARADYDAALARDPKLAWSLYGRGLARLRSGDEAGGKTDIAAAAAIQPDIAQEAKRYGVAQ